MARTTRLKGSFPPLITPFTGGDVDYATYERLLEIQVKKGSHGIVVNGTTAEPSTLTVEERSRLVSLAVKVVSGTRPSRCGYGLTVARGDQSAHGLRGRAGADALLIVTPYYIRPPQRGLIEYYLELTKEIDVPCMIYHIPGRTVVQLTLETVKEIAARSRTFVGIKHASPDLAFVSECLDALGPDFRVFAGLEELSLPMMTIGASGLMNAVGNLFPGVLAELCEAVWNNDLARGRYLHQRLLEINKAVFFDTNPIPVKYMMKRIGLIPRNEHRLPMAPATPELERRLDGVLERYAARADEAP